MMFHAGQKAVLMLEVGIGPRVIAARVDGVGLPNVAPSVAGLGTNMVGEKIAPLAVHLEMRNRHSRRRRRWFPTRRGRDKRASELRAPAPRPLWLNRELEYGGLKLKRHPADYFADDRIFVGCEGNEKGAGVRVERVRPKPFMFASDFPHEISISNCMEKIDESSSARISRKGTRPRFSARTPGDSTAAKREDRGS